MTDCLITSHCPVLQFKRRPKGEHPNSTHQGNHRLFDDSQTTSRVIAPTTVRCLKWPPILLHHPSETACGQHLWTHAHIHLQNHELQLKTCYAQRQAGEVRSCQCYTEVWGLAQVSELDCSPQELGLSIVWTLITRQRHRETWNCPEKVAWPLKADSFPCQIQISDWQTLRKPPQSNSGAAAPHQPLQASSLQTISASVFQATTSRCCGSRQRLQQSRSSLAGGEGSITEHRPEFLTSYLRSPRRKPGKGWGLRTAPPGRAAIPSATQGCELLLQAPPFLRAAWYHLQYCLRNRARPAPSHGWPHRGAG